MTGRLYLVAGAVTKAARWTAYGSPPIGGGLEADEGREENGAA